MMKLEVVKKTNPTPRVLGQVPPRTDIQDMIEISKIVDMKDYHVLVTLF